MDEKEDHEGVIWVADLHYGVTILMTLGVFSYISLLNIVCTITRLGILNMVTIKQVAVPLSL